jgi:regulator of cell morphogenesis and NO signaling
MSSIPVPRAVDLTWTVNEVLREHPGTIGAFNAFGVDACCGGAATLRDAARAAGVLPETLLFAVESVVHDAAEAAARGAR